VETGPLSGRPLRNHLLIARAMMPIIMTKYMDMKIDVNRFWSWMFDQWEMGPGLWWPCNIVDQAVPRPGISFWLNIDGDFNLLPLKFVLYKLKSHIPVQMYHVNSWKSSKFLADYRIPQ